MKTFDRRLFRFVFVGVLNTLFGLGAYALLVRSCLPIWAALVGGNAAGIAFNFFTTGHLVFSELALGRLPRFVAAYLGLYLVNYVSIRALLATGLGPIASQTLITPMMALLSFYLMSKHVFDQPRKKDTHE